MDPAEVEAIVAVLDETVEVAGTTRAPGTTTMLGFDWLVDLNGTGDSLIALTLFTTLPEALLSALPWMVGPLPALVAAAALLMGEV